MIFWCKSFDKSFICYLKSMAHSKSIKASIKYTNQIFLMTCHTFDLYAKVYFLTSESISPNLKLQWIQDLAEEQVWNGKFSKLSSINKKNIWGGKNWVTVKSWGECSERKKTWWVFHPGEFHLEKPEEKEVDFEIDMRFGLDTIKNFLAVNIIEPLNCDSGSLLYSFILDQNLEIKLYISFAFSIILHEKELRLSNLQLFTENSQQRNIRKDYEVIFSQ